MKNLGKRITSGVLLCSVLCYTMPILAFTKDETVYSNLDGNGEVYQTTVSDHLKNTDGENILKDLSDLMNIENVNGEQKLEKEGNTLVWEANGEDIYYQGTTKKDLPIECKVKYSLDEEEISKEDIKGKTGKVKITLEFTNKEARTVNINGKQKTMYVPFTVACGTVINNEKAKNIEVTNGKAIDNGNKTMVFGIALPGMQESLGISKNKIEIPNSVSIEMEATDFDLGEIYIFATPKIIEDKDLDIFDDLNQMYQKIDTLQSSSKSIKEGADALAEGMNTLKEGMETASKSNALDTKTLTEIGKQASDTAEVTIEKQKEAIGKQAANEAAKIIEKQEEAIGKSAANEATKTIDKQKETIGKQATSEAAKTIAKQEETIGKQAANEATKIIAKQEEAIGKQAANEATKTIEKQKDGIVKQATNLAQNSLKQKMASIKKEASDTALKEVLGQIKTEAEIEKEAMSGIKAYLKANPTYEALYNTLDANQKKLFEEAIKQTAVSVAEEAQQTTTVAIKKVAEGTAEKVATEITTQVASQTAEAVAETVAGEVANQTAKSVAGTVAGEVANQTAKSVAGTVAGEVANQTAKSVAGTVAGEVANQTAKSVAGTVAGEVANQTAKSVAGTVASEVSNQTAIVTADTVANEVKNQVISSMKDGVNELSNGTNTLAEGIDTFNREGIDKICDMVKGEVKDLQNRIEKLQDLANEYNSFTMAEENAQGNVKFILMIDSLDKKRKN